VLHYGGAADHHRTWRKVADHDAIADYRLAADNTSRGWALSSADRRPFRRRRRAAR